VQEETKNQRPDRERFGARQVVEKATGQLTEHAVEANELSHDVMSW